MSFNRNIDVLFVVPSFAPQLEQESIGTLILAKTAQLAHYKIKVLRYWEVDKDLNRYDSFAKRMVDYIRDLSPKIVCFYCRNNDYHICIDISRRLKSNLRNCIIVFGGPQADLVAEPTLRSFPFVDFVCCGEGEHTIIPTTSYILQGKSIIEAQSIPGLVYRKDSSTICKNDLPRLIENGYKRGFYYYDLIPNIVFENSSSIGIDIGRGCPFSCTFCSTKTFWKQKYRLREIDDILDEIEFVHNKYGIELFSFEHDLFTLDKHKVFEFCSKLISRKITIKWNCSSRIDTIDREMIDVMVKSGLSGIYFGIESGAPKIQKTTNKNLDLNKTIDIIRYSISKQLSITASFIYGFPEETESDLESTLQLMFDLIKIGVKNVQMHRLSIENGTALFEQYKSLLIPPHRTQIRAFGSSDLFDLICQNKEVFSSFMDFSTSIRKEFRHLDIFFYVVTTYPKTFIQIMAILKEHNYTAINMCRLFLANCESNIISILSRNTSIFSPAICTFLAQIFINKMIFGKQSEEIGLTTCEKNQIHRALTQELLEIQ